MAKISLKLSETTTVDYNLTASWWTQLKMLNLSPIFRWLSWAFLAVLSIMPLVLYSLLGVANSQSAQLHAVLTVGGAALLLLVAWAGFAKLQHFADPPMFLAVLIFALIQIAILLTNAGTGNQNQINTFGSADTKLFSGVAIMALVAIFYTSVVTLNTQRKRRLIGVSLLLSLALITLHIVVTPAQRIAADSFLVAATWLVSTAILFGGYRRTLLVSAIFVWLIASYQLFFGINELLTLPIVLIISLVYGIALFRREKLNIKTGWKELWNNFKKFIEGDVSWPMFAKQFQAHLWVLVAVVLALMTIVYIMQPSTVVVVAGNTGAKLDEITAFISKEASTLNTVWQSLQLNNKVLFGYGLFSQPQTGTILSILGSTGIIGMLAYAVLSGSAVYFSFKQWFTSKHASWAGLWWPVLLLLPIYNLAHKIDLTSLFIWWIMFAHLAAIEQWHKQPKLYKLWEVVTFKNRVVSKPLAIAQLIVVVLLIIFLVIFVRNLNDLLIKGVI